MSAKLVVHKFDSSNNFKYLCITFEDGVNGLCNTKYSSWMEGKTQHQKKYAQKPRLVMKIVTESEENMNLDACACELGDPQDCFNNAFQKSTNVSNYEKMANANNKYSYLFENYSNYEERGGGLGSLYQSACPRDTQQAGKSAISYGNVCPLEYSLEKIKENNARIMENIHVLNRTLDYTKQKEILNIDCPKILRYPCDTCGKCFVYKTGLKRHYSMRHALTEMQPRWQVVWTCIECFQVWPRHDLAMDHASQCCKTETIDYVREIKTSSLLQCEFCEKVFTSIPRLLRHSKIHTTAHNYECNACETSFASYKAAEQHWLFCPWLKMYYNFSLPKMLLCNACDRKFRNYEQLYNHRYKVGHYMTKTHSTKSSIKCLGSLVYQCEICAEWFNSILLLQVHRNQNHSAYDTYDIDAQYKIDGNVQGNEGICCETVANENYMNQIDNLTNQQYL